MHFKYIFIITQKGPLKLLNTKYILRLHILQKGCIKVRHSKYTDYGIRILIYLYMKKQSLVTNREISDYYKISYNHVVKLANHLGRQKLIHIVRGRRGGYRLADGYESFTLGYIIKRLEQDFVLVECFDTKKNKCVITPFCRVKGHLKKALEAYFLELDKVKFIEFAQKFSVPD